MSIADEILNYWISLLLKVRMFGWFFSDFYSLEMKHIYSLIVFAAALACTITSGGREM